MNNDESWWSGEGILILIISLDTQPEARWAGIGTPVPIFEEWSIFDFFTLSG